MTSNPTKGIALPVIITLIAVALLGGGGIYFASTQKDKEVMEKNEGDQAMEDGTHGNTGDTMVKPVATATTTEETTVKSGDAMAKPEEVMKKDEAMEGTMFKGKVLAGTKSPLIDFNKADYDAALASKKLIVLYYYASWCPICKAETTNSLYPAFNELQNENVIGFRVNYKDDTTDKDEESLAREHGVAYQHTKVFIKDGTRILKAPDGWDKARYLTEIKKALQ